MKFGGCLAECGFVNTQGMLRGGVQQAGDGCVVDAAWIAASKLVDVILDCFVKDFGIAAMMTDLVVDVLARLLLGKWPELVADTNAIDDIRVL